MIQIKHKLTGHVLFEAEVNLFRSALEIAVKNGADLHDADLRDADLRDADLHGADLHGADLLDANLRDANLRDANLRYADLHYADLRGADLRYAKNAPLILFGLSYSISITDSHISIGCETHSINEWRSFSDEQIIEMDGKYAIEFWSTHKTAIIALAEHHATTYARDDDEHQD